ncbi:MarR family transcriptional regulator [Ruminococcus albus]|uniref:Uncharacterized protein n=1 Tax=Ruminococcus albus (strain ATCC 27210 / DSM 20455 / JCM 14654 / NCDO 2250 / 7) TaxID=697329 RepID=E6UL88_RUMA7|nr:MarR family transcriptional regulator [Ruminococcus albus]ADU24434.1 hypothetical protein Rumal_4014 [Ruminococcus albus 7 = DSM 20455]
MSKTIKQIADELGVSKDRVKYLVKKLPSGWVEKRGNITYINADGERNIYMLEGKKWGKSDEITHIETELDRVISTHLPTEEQKKDMEIERLKARVAELERQLEYERANSEEKQALLKAWNDEQIQQFNRIIEDNKKLLQLIDQEQQLHLRSIESKDKGLAIEEKQPEPKRHWWQRKRKEPTEE